MSQTISIIIPILNEADGIGSLLKYILQNSSANNVKELLVVDGGSTDASVSIVQDFITNCENNNQQKQCSNIRLLHSEKGRAKQLNLGAQNASGSIFYFLHADSFPPKHFDAFILNEIEKGHKAGCFRMQFDSSHWWLRLASWLTQFSWRACRGGDQSQFITRDLFQDIGGYDESYVIYEDNMLINELYRRNEFVVINQKLRSSARRYETYGVWKLQYHFWMIYLKKWFGASADDLSSYYKRHIC